MHSFPAAAGVTDCPKLGGSGQQKCVPSPVEAWSAIGVWPVLVLSGVGGQGGGSLPDSPRFWPLLPTLASLICGGITHTLPCLHTGALTSGFGAPLSPGRSQLRLLVIPSAMDLFPNGSPSHPQACHLGSLSNQAERVSDNSSSTCA